jgi:hypothetical protein
MKIKWAWQLARRRFIELYGNTFSGGTLPALPFQRFWANKNAFGCALGLDSNTFDCPWPARARKLCRESRHPPFSSGMAQHHGS